MRRIRNLIKRHWKRFFELGQRVGVDVLPRHFYSSIPDFRQLRSDDRWRTPYEMTGVAGADLREQEQFLREWMTHEIRGRLSNGNVWPSARRANGEEGYGIPDADVLFAFIASQRPRRVMQIGCGVSTFIMLDAATQANHDIQITCIEPFPSQALRDAARAERITLIEQPAEHVAAKSLADLSAGDLLFVDSSHATRPGSDVHHLIFRVLPLLSAGVWIHFHDVQFPYDFGPNILGPADLFFGGESYLLHAFLIQNAKCRIAASLSMLHHAAPGVLSELIPNYSPVKTDRGLNPPDSAGKTPSATYLRTI